MTDTLEAGTTVGAYQLIEPVGRGGMGGVWAVQDAAGHRYALKSPASGLRAEDGVLRRFGREAKAMCLIDHPNVVSVVDVFVEGESLYLVMELVAGSTLAKLIFKAGRWLRSVRSPSRGNCSTASVMPTRSGSCTATSSLPTSWSSRRPKANA